MKLVHAEQDEQERPVGLGDCGPIRRLSVLMPVYNERWTLREIVARVLSAPVPLEIELIIVDDCSTDGSWEVIQELAAADPRIKPLRHARNAGKGSALRTAIAQISGEVAIVQDADLEYDPHEYRLLLPPILSGKADAVFGSRYSGSTRRVTPFWHTLVNQGLTLLSNIVNNSWLTDMETCYKMVRSDILRQLRLRSRTFTFEPELACRLAQWGARIYEVPISYNSRGYCDGKKIRPRDGFLALGEIVRAGILDRRFTDHAEFYALATSARAVRHYRRLAGQIAPYLGPRVLEIGAGVGSLSSMLVHRERLVLVDEESLCIPVLRQRFGDRRNVRIEQGCLAADDFRRWRDEAFDTFLCSRSTERCLTDDRVLPNIYELLAPGGHCVLLLDADVASGAVEPSRPDRRPLTVANVRQAMTAAGFAVVLAKRLSMPSRAPRDSIGRRLSLADRFRPITRWVEAIVPSVGRSLLVVGRKPDSAARRAAA